MYPEEVIRYISGNYSQEDKEFVKNWLEEEDISYDELGRLQEVWEAAEDLKLENNVDRVWKELSERIKREADSQKVTKIGRFPTKKANIKIRGFIVRAAAAILVIACAYAFYQFAYTQNPVHKQKLVYNTLVSKKGEQIRFRFNDGSKVVLNGNSKIRYRSDFGTGTRNLYLSGEAYFEVKHDHTLPFVVYAGNMKVKDIGTKFDINAYPEGNFYEVSVSDGQIQVATREHDGNKDSLKAPQHVNITQGQKVEVGRNSGQMIISKANLHASLDWLNKRLIFDEEPFSLIVNRLERYYDITIDVRDKALLTKKVTASFENERMENVLKVLSLSLKANYNLNKNHVVFYKKNR